jgi:hypothetical protein
MNRRLPSRRTFLRGILGGAAVSVGIPWLEALHVPRYASAAGVDSFPKRFGLFFWGNGVLPGDGQGIPDQWTPTGSGTNWELSEQLSPLAPMKQHVTVISRMQVTTGNPAAHAGGPAGLLSGRPLLRNGADYTFAGPSIDQILAESVGSQTRFRSLEIAVEPGARGLSHTGPNTINPAEYSPVALFERLFGAEFRAPGDEPIVDPKLSLRRSVLDAVQEDSLALQRRASASDRARLDQHFTAVRDLELRIARLLEDPPNLAACMRPPAVDEIPFVDGRPQMPVIAATMADLLAMALACDQTRVFSLWYSTPVNNVLYPGANAGHHQLTHDEPGDQPMVNTIVKGIMGDLNTFLQKLDAIPEGDGTLLEHCGILASSDVSYGRTHSIDRYPIVVCGSMGGRLRTGVHIVSEIQDNVAKVPFTMANAMGANLASFGDGPGLVTSTLGDLEAT